MEEIKQVPYGVSDFVMVRERNLYYVDKTMFLSLLEQQPDNVFYIRPRRFGKSLFISMMRAYYDKAMAANFDSLFGGLWVHEHPTPLRGRYQMLYLDFSQVGGDIDRLSERFNDYCSLMLDDFMHSYRDEYPDETVKAFFETRQMADKLDLIRNSAVRLRIPLYLIIDEYDNFTNIVLNENGEEVYHAITHASGFYRDVFKKFKGMFERIFMTGVSPVTLDDLTSGFNIGWHLSMNPKFDKMLGFSTEDVRSMLLYYKEAGMLPSESDVEAMIAEMKPWYDNYCFAKECLKQEERVFNCDMVLYYLRQYMDSGHSPERMVDPNTKTDYNKLKKLLRLDRLDGDRRGVIRRIAEEGQLIAGVEESFPARDLTNPDIFPSLLFYYGMLTIKGTYGSQLVLCIPNNNVRKQYYEYLLENYSEYSGIQISSLLTLFTRMSFDGQWREALQYIADAYRNLSSVRDSIEGERSIQGFFMAYLSLNDYYITAPEVELNHGYCDFFLLPNLTHYQSRHSYIVELKYLPKKDFDSKAEEQWRQAVEQIDGYARAPRVDALRQGTQLHKIVMQFSGWDLVRMEEV
ncbi:ATP-binding protein [Phocaeicola sartorii]|uniref:ATP-binding protein n=1 Tax=Phocaeicola sartorii TaxID=671267 RepID=UPI00258E726C|nr:ATP-binding protein [Phocaeicola sartorii]